MDGRTARRQRNREAVLDAVAELFRAGDTEPSIEAIAEHAQVSVRSIYRYFSHREDLVRAAMGHVIAQVVPTIQLEDVGRGSFEERVERFVDHRIRMYRALAPITRAARRAAHSEPLVADEFETGRLVLRQQFLDQFDEELAGLSAGARTRAVVAAELPFQFESFEFLWRSFDDNVDEMRRFLVDQLTMNLGRFRDPARATEHAG